MLRLVPMVLFIAVVLWAMGQVRRPSGWLGRRTVLNMNERHAALTDWGLNHVEVPRNGAILDVGCGGGRTVQRLAGLAAEGSVVGIDNSAASVTGSRETNARQIEAGRVRIELGSVAALPYPDRTFDVVTAVETHYYWPNLAASTSEVLRVLKPGGTLALIAETHRDGWTGALYTVPLWLIRAAHLSEAEYKKLLIGAGFTEVETFLHGSDWICARGRRPAAAGNA